MSQIEKKFTKEMYQATYTVTPEHNNIRLDAFLMHLFPTFSRQYIKKKIKLAEIKIMNRPFPHKPSVKVYHGEIVEITTYPGDLEDEYWDGQKVLLTEPTIVYQDDDLLTISKPPYMSTHPTGKHLFNCATVYYQTRLGHTIHSIHRLDRETSGIQLLGKNPKISQVLTSFFENDQVQKAYFLIGHKKQKIEFPIACQQRLGTIENYIPRLYAHCFPRESHEGKEAHTKFALICESADYVLALAFPITGRQHQIRAHAAHLGFPLLGDKLYNGDPTVFMRFKDGDATPADHQKMQIPRHALHAIALKMPYEKQQIFRAPLPQDLVTWIQENLDFEITEIESKIDSTIKDFFQVGKHS
jgi:RluA family pseudouridine synthase